jgi:acyl carrier protein
VKSPFPHRDLLLGQLRQILVDKFRLNAALAGGLTTDELLIGGRSGLDSLDALELGLQLEETFGLTIVSAGESNRAFASLGSLADHIRRHAAMPPRSA